MRPDRAPALCMMLALLLFAACPADDAAERAVRTSSESEAEPSLPPAWSEPWQPALVSCAPCHERVFREWSQSAHATAWRDRNARQASRDFERTECRACHAPQAVFATGLDRIAAERNAQREDGVHCLSCHGLPDGLAGVAALRDLPDAPCQPRAVPALATNALCFPCHEPGQGTLSEFERSQAAKQGVRCVDCHLPQVADRPGRSHADWGGANERFVRGAVSMQCRVKENALWIELKNHTPHRVPAESRTRALVLRVQHPDDSVSYESFRRPNEDEADLDQRLEPEELRTLRFDLRAGTEPPRVDLLFKTFPLQPDMAAFVVSRWP